MKIFLQDTTRKTVFTVACATSFSLPAAAAQKQPNSEYGLLISALVHQNLASVLARRDPGSNAGPGQGAASCSFWIKPTAQVTRLKCSGSTPGQAAVLRQTIKATQFPPRLPDLASWRSKRSNFPADCGRAVHHPKCNFRPTSYRLIRHE